MSVSEQYDLKIKRNPFKLHKEHKIIATGKNHKEKTSSKKQRVLIASSPQLRTFYNINTQRQSNRLSLKQIQPFKEKFFRNPNCETQIHENYEQQTTGYRLSVNQKVKMSLNNLKITSRLKNYEKYTNQKKQQRQRTPNQKLKFTYKQFEQKNQQKTAVQIQKKQKLNSGKSKLILSPRDSIKKSVDNISKPIERKQKKNTQKNNPSNTLFDRTKQTKQFIVQINQQQSESILDFTFGKNT